MESLGRNACVRARTGMLWQQFDDESVLLDLDRGVYYELNAVGTRVWELLQQPRAAAELPDILAGEFEVDPAQCAADVEQLLNDLRERAMVEVSSDR